MGLSEMGSCESTLMTSPTVVHHNESNFRSAIIDLIGGSLGGVANVVVGQPLDTVKVKMQTFPTMYRGAMHCFLQTYKNDNIRGLYAGTVPSLAASIAENSVLFCAYGMCQKCVQFVVQKQKASELNALENAFAGFLAAFFSALSLCPTELVKCRLQAMTEMQALKGEMGSTLQIGPLSLTRQILKEEGIQGLFRGLTATLVREMPGYFCFFGGYEVTRSLLTPPGKTKDEIGLLRTIISGGVGGIALWIVIFPADVVKSRIQVAGSTEPMLSLTKHIIKTEGVRALYSGLGPTLLRTFPSTGALFVAYEYSKKYLHLWTDDL